MTPAAPLVIYNSPRASRNRPGKKSPLRGGYLDSQQRDTLLDTHTHMHMPIKWKINSWLNAMDFNSMEHKICSDTMINDM